MTINFKEGILIPIDKPYGVTSFKALAHIRYLCSHALGGKVKMGHAGTLDPLATGVLVLATGKRQSRSRRCSNTRRSMSPRYSWGRRP